MRWLWMAIILTAPAVLRAHPTPDMTTPLYLWLSIQPDVAEFNGDGYKRSEFPHWSDADKDCQNSREEALIRDSVTTPKLDDKGCKVLSGTWIGFFTGKTYTLRKELDVDHIVPLKEAYESGAAMWSKEKGRTFANDLDPDVPQLRPVALGANRSKGARDPYEWLPEYNVCAYVDQWTRIKRRWGLTFDANERVTILKILRICK